MNNDSLASMHELAISRTISNHDIFYVIGEPFGHPILAMLWDSHATITECIIIFTPQLAGEARQLGYPKIVLDNVRMYIYIYIYMFVRTTMLKYTLYWKYMNWRRTSNRNTSSSWYM